MILFHRFTGSIATHRDAIHDVFRFIGLTDAAISVMRLRRAAKTCRPTFTDGKYLEAVQVVHPLIEGCTANTLTLDGTGLLEHIRALDMEKEYDITLWYDDRYEIKLGGTDELAYKIRYLCSILDQLSEYQAGTIDLTQAAQKKATFQPAA